MKQFILSAPPDPEGMIRLYDKDYHYLVRVRRLRPGSCFDAVLPNGAGTRVRILSTVNGSLIGECVDTDDVLPAERVPAENIPLPPIALFQGIPKGTKMDLIIRQAVEAGVSVVAPFESEYSTVRLDKQSHGFSNQRFAEKLKRWERIAREARQQSGSVIDTEIRAPGGLGLGDRTGLEGLLGYWESLKKEYQRPMGILLHQSPAQAPSLQGGDRPLVKGTFHGYLDSNPDFVVLAVGPEGGFSPGEVSLFLAAGWKPLVMGTTVLRTETAALYGIAAVQTILLESESWIPSGSHS